MQASDRRNGKVRRKRLDIGYIFQQFNLAKEGLLDILSSDYYPASLLRAGFVPGLRAYYR